MGNRPPAPDRACQSIKLPLGAPQAFNPAPCDAFTARIILKRWACLFMGASCSIVRREILSRNGICGWNRSKPKWAQGICHRLATNRLLAKSSWRVSVYVVQCLAPRCWRRVRLPKTHHHCQCLLYHLRQIL